jgi:DNA-binding transcriptional MerR regulator
VDEAFPIGRLAELTGLPVKTIRFYSDAGLLPPSGRTQAGHRRYTATDVARLQLVRTLRDLDVDLGTIGHLMASRRGLAELLAAHVAALEVRDRALHRQLAVVRAAAASPTTATLARVHALARLEAAERGRLLDRFWDHLTEGLPVGAATAQLRDAGTPELPADPAPEQLDAWLELAELVADEDFQRTTRANAGWGAEVVGDAFDPDTWARAVSGAGDGRRARFASRQSAPSRSQPRCSMSTRAEALLRRPRRDQRIHTSSGPLCARLEAASHAISRCRVTDRDDAAMTPSWPLDEGGRGADHRPRRRRAAQRSGVGTTREPSSRSSKPGLWATSQVWPSGSRNTPV